MPGLFSDGPGDDRHLGRAFQRHDTVPDGVEPGRRIRLHGAVGLRDDGELAMINPAYDLMAAEP